MTHQREDRETEQFITALADLLRAWTSPSNGMNARCLVAGPCVGRRRSVWDQERARSAGIGEEGG